MFQFARFTLCFITLILLARLSTLLARRFALPASTIQIAVGVLLGPSLLNLLQGPVLLSNWGRPSSGPLNDLAKIVSEVGLIQLLFMAGLQADWPALKRNFRPAFGLSAAGFFAAAAGAAAVVRCFVPNWPEALAMASVMSVTSIGINLYFQSSFLEGADGHEPEAKALLLWSGLLTWTFGILLIVSALSLNYLAIHGPFKSLIATSWFSGKLILYVAVTYFMLSRFLQWGKKRGSERRVLHRVIGYFLLVASLYAWGAIHFGSFAAVPAAFFGGGLFLFSHPEWKERVGTGLRSFFGSLPIGIFFVVLGMQLDFREAGKWAIPLTLATAVVLGVKILSARMALKGFLRSSRERLELISGTVQPGEIGILIAVYLFSRGLVHPLMFRGAVTVLVTLTLFGSIMSIGRMGKCGSVRL